ncbi:uncharacterized protein LOC125669044 [Ostrea edulis]|uniref:uncharacterized protein LOC125669044 n=1 Tax=Ostrea edulis TaxID=37623 RepID=UPI0024AF4707|nr:uncharacterized protein LOC125669044 [Ostrea edulis]
MRDAKIVTLYKNKGERSDCNNYRGISHFSIFGQVYARVLLQKLHERVYLKSNCGFRVKRSTIDMVFSFRQLQEKCREQQMPLYIAFIDLTKAFDLVSRDGLFKALRKIGCPITVQLNRVLPYQHEGDFATPTQRDLQLLMDHFSQACKDFGLTISLKKTNIIGQDTPTPPVITIDNYELKVVHQFTYLGSTFTDNSSLTLRSTKGSGYAVTTFARLTSRVWTNTKLTMKTKMAVYNACVLSTLLCGSEIWTMYDQQEKKVQHLPHQNRLR